MIAILKDTMTYLDIATLDKSLASINKRYDKSALEESNNVPEWANILTPFQFKRHGFEVFFNRSIPKDFEQSNQEKIEHQSTQDYLLLTYKDLTNPRYSQTLAD